MPLTQTCEVGGQHRFFRSIVHLVFFFLFMAALQATAQQRQVQGLVQDAATHAPLPLATISIKVNGVPGNTKITDSKGRFSFPAVPGTSLEVSYTGYKTRQIAVQDDSTTVTILLEAGDSKLDQVVVIGYGKEKRTDLTSAISSISG